MHLHKFFLPDSPHKAGKRMCAMHCKNLKMNEIPNCMFENSEGRKGDSYADFAKLVNNEN